jgi:protein-disulfide isomerase
LLAASVALLTTVQARRRGISPKTPALGTGVLFMGTWVAVGSGLILSYLSTFIIKSLCLLCAGLEVSNIVLAILMLLYIRRARLSPLEPLLKDFRFAGGHLKIAAPVVAVFFATSAGLLAAYPSYWEILEPHGPGDLPHGFTDEGHPWIGAEKPKATIMEFTDFQCPFCQNAHAYARRMVEKYPHKVRLIHRDFPLDHHCNPEVTKPYHLRACQLSKAARCAGEQKKYWEMADLIFSRRDRQGGPDPYALAFRLDLDKDAFSKCMRSKKVHEALMRDINKANRLGLQGTPTYFINGNLLRSWPTEPIIKVFLEES